MKQAVVTIKYDEEKLNAVKQYMGKKDADFDAELKEVLGKMYEKYVLEKKNKLRIRYAKEVSFGTDVSLFFKTVTAVFKKAMRVVGKSNREK